MNIEEKRKFLKDNYVFLAERFSPTCPSNFLGEWIGEKDNLDSYVIHKKVDGSLLSEANYQEVLSIFENNNFVEGVDYAEITHGRTFASGTSLIVFRMFDGDKITPIALKVEEILNNLDGHPTLNESRLSELEADTLEEKMEEESFILYGKNDYMLEEEEREFLEDYMKVFITIIKNCNIIEDINCRIEDFDWGPELHYEEEYIVELFGDVFNSKHHKKKEMLFVKNNNFWNDKEVEWIVFEESGRILFALNRKKNEKEFLSFCKEKGVMDIHRTIMTDLGQLKFF